MDVARASGTDLASSLRQNMFLIAKKIDFDVKSGFDHHVMAVTPALGERGVVWPAANNTVRSNLG